MDVIYPQECPPPPPQQGGINVNVDVSATGNKVIVTGNTYGNGAGPAPGPAPSPVTPSPVTPSPAPCTDVGFVPCQGDPCNCCEGLICYEFDDYDPDVKCRGNTYICDIPKENGGCSACFPPECLHVTDPVPDPVSRPSKGKGGYGKPSPYGPSKGYGKGYSGGQPHGNPYPYGPSKGYGGDSYDPYGRRKMLKAYKTAKSKPGSASVP